MVYLGNNHKEEVMYSDHKEWVVMERRRERPHIERHCGTGFRHKLEIIFNAGSNHAEAVKKLARLCEQDPGKEYFLAPFDAGLTLLNCRRDQSFWGDIERRIHLQEMLYAEAEAIRIFLCRCKHDGIDPYEAKYPFAKVMRDIFQGKESEPIEGSPGL